MMNKSNPPSSLYTCASIMWNFSSRKQIFCLNGKLPDPSHRSGRRELEEEMTAPWITLLLVPWIKHVRGPAGATADSRSRLELWEVGVLSTLGENGVWLTMGSVLLREQQVGRELLKWLFIEMSREEQLNRMSWHLTWGDRECVCDVFTARTESGVSVSLKSFICRVFLLHRETDRLWHKKLDSHIILVLPSPSGLK